MLSSSYIIIEEEAYRSIQAQLVEETCLMRVIFTTILGTEHPIGYVIVIQYKQFRTYIYCIYQLRSYYHKHCL